MKNATLVFSDYYARLDRFSRARYGTPPTVAFSEALSPELLVGSPDDEGEVEWRPVWLNQPLDWRSIEGEVGFTPAEEIKTYYSTWLFALLAGEDSGTFLNFYPILSVDGIPGLVLRQHEEAKHVFPDSQRFLIGNAVIDGDDGYFIYFDNTDSSVFCYEEDTNHRILLSNSLLDLIDRLDACD